MNGKIQTHLMMLISFTLCNTSSMVLAAYTAIAADEEISMTQERVVSAALRIDDEVVEMLPSGKAIHTTTTLRGKRIDCLGRVVKGIAEEERYNMVGGAPDIGCGPRVQ